MVMNLGHFCAFDVSVSLSFFGFLCQNPIRGYIKDSSRDTPDLSEVIVVHTFEYFFRTFTIWET